MNPWVRQVVIWGLEHSPLRSRILWRAPREGRGVAFTFDDGPTPTFTSRILDRLRAAGVRATFFVEGARVERHPEILRRILEEQHEPGNHGYAHDGTPLLLQAAQCDAVLRRFGVVTRWFRPPRGRLGLREACGLWRRGYRIVLWSVDARDSMRFEGKWTRPGPDYRSLRPGDIVLFHDDNPLALQDLERALEVVRERQWAAVPLSELTRWGP